MEARYPESVDVVVSACNHEYSVISPSGRWLSVREKNSETISVYLLDLQVDERTPFPGLDKAGFHFLTDDLLYVTFSYEDNFILDRTTGNQYPVHRFLIARSDAYEGDNANPDLLAEILRQAKYVFFKEEGGSIIALDPNFPASSEKNFLILRFDIADNRSEQFLKENNIAYEIIYPDLLEDVISPDGRFIARHDGIYLFDTGKKIADGYSIRRLLSRQYFSVRGWVSDSSGVIYSKFGEPCLIELGLGIDYRSCYYEVEQPVIKLKVPEAYLSSQGIP
jgi:hypothetical protein